MYRSSATYGMSWKERIEYREKCSAQIANQKSDNANTLDRLKDMIVAIENALKPEADQLFAKIVESWKTAHLYVLENGKTFNAVRTAYTGYDIDANPIPTFSGRHRVVGSYTQPTPEYLEWSKKEEFQSRIRDRFSSTRQAVICLRKLYDINDLMVHAEKDAAEVIEANKVKLLQGIAKYMQPYQSAEIKNHLIKIGAKGFQGAFKLITDKGARMFTCKAITAEGPVVSFHWRYIIHVKEI